MHVSKLCLLPPIIFYMLTWQFLQDLEYYASLGMAEPCFTLKGQGAFRGLYAEAGLGFTGSAYERVYK